MPGACSQRKVQFVSLRSRLLSAGATQSAQVSKQGHWGSAASQKDLISGRTKRNDKRKSLAPQIPQRRGLLRARRPSSAVTGGPGNKNDRTFLQWVADSSVRTYGCRIPKKNDTHGETSAA